LIAVVEQDLPYATQMVEPATHTITAIGPEGDFDPVEINEAQKHDFQKVSLGNNTLRTETAGMVAAQMINVINTY
jgi:16S rRNA (uracil1498-N3)-methyltransferase